MRIFVFLLISVLLHAVMIANINLRLQITPKMQLNTTVVRVEIVKKALLPIVGLKQKVEKAVKNKSAHLETKVEVIKRTINNQTVNNPTVEASKALKPPPITLALEIDSEVNKDLEAEAVSVDDYLSADEIDRKALPQTSLSESDSVGRFSSGLPIKLRLYINLFGRLVKIERIKVLDQDDFFASQLEEQLYGITFLPARRNGVDVDSYQEIEFSFNTTSKLLN